MIENLPNVPIVFDQTQVVSMDFDFSLINFPASFGSHKNFIHPTHEPCCQVLHGVTTGAIRKSRLDSYQKMKRELVYLSDRQTKSADRLEKERWKEVSLKIKAINNRRANHV